MQTGASAELRMHAERTPNPDSVKWVLDRTLVPGGGHASFGRGTSPEVSPLAAALLQLDGVEGVLLGPDFVTVSKAHGRAWSELAESVPAALRSWAAAGEPALGAGWAPTRGDAPDAPEDPVVGRIRAILDGEIAPYVEQDGGEISLQGFEDGVVKVRLRGACAGCPSSTITLKMGIEARLREELPEVRSVEAV